MNRNANTSIAHALSGGRACVRVAAQMTLSLAFMGNGGVQDPGEGQAASP